MDWAAEDLPEPEDEALIPWPDGDAAASEAQAGALAFEGRVTNWLDQHPVRSSPDRCAHCGGSDRPGDPLVPVGSGPAWIHQACWEPWRTDRRDRAVAALGAMGITMRAPAEVIPLARTRRGRRA